MAHAKTATLAETGSCPLCNSRLIVDNRIVVLGAWQVSRVYACGTSLGGTIGQPMTIEKECDRMGHLRKVT